MNNSPAFPNPFNAAAFCILMDHHGRGVEEAHPAYIMEKLPEFQLFPETHAAAMLDSRNQERLRQWCKQWNYPVPEELQTWLKELE